MKLSLGIPIIVKNARIFGPRGSNKADLLLDTGAAFTVISWSFMKSIGYDPAIASERQELVTANGIIEVPRLRVKSIIVGDVKANEVEVICHDIPEIAEIRGLLGLNFLMNFRTVIDYKQGYLEIS